MKRTTILVATLAIAACGQEQTVAPSADLLVIRGGWLFDGIADERRPNSGIVIEDGIFVAVDADIPPQILQTARVIQLAETDTILPGMIDLHAHYNLPLTMVGGDRAIHQGGRHLVFPEDTPMTNLLLSMLDKVGVEVESLGDSTGRLPV